MHLKSTRTHMYSRWIQTSRRRFRSSVVFLKGRNTNTLFTCQADIKNFDIFNSALTSQNGVDIFWAALRSRTAQMTYLWIQVTLAGWVTGPLLTAEVVERADERESQSRRHSHQRPQKQGAASTCRKAQRSKSSAAADVDIGVSGEESLLIYREASSDRRT